jgi:hypothetical protein
MAFNDLLHAHSRLNAKEKKRSLLAPCSIMRKETRRMELSASINAQRRAKLTDSPGQTRVFFSERRDEARGSAGSDSLLRPRARRGVGRGKRETLTRRVGCWCRLKRSRGFRQFIWVG